MISVSHWGMFDIPAYDSLFRACRDLYGDCTFNLPELSYDSKYLHENK